jgi:glycosyltransferase involved in cell wall biosynthesis
MIDTHRRGGTWQNHVDRFVVLSAFARERFERAGFPAEKMIVRPSSVDDPGPLEEGERAGIVYAGRLSDEKGVRVLIEAARAQPSRSRSSARGRLRPSSPPLRRTMYGFAVRSRARR